MPAQASLSSLNSIKFCSAVMDNVMHVSDWVPTLLHAAGADKCTMKDFEGIDGVDQYDQIFKGKFNKVSPHLFC